ncbi:MAG: radical SAM protein [Bacteroidetes bacterium]|nr:radical SAM protein [Bacteroidota bacterium]
MTDAVLHVIAKYENIWGTSICRFKSGNSSNVLERMNRGYTSEDYIQRIESIRRIIPECGISTDIISGFCGETEEEHQDTLSLMEWAGYDFSYMFKYSERPGTAAEKKFTDDIPGRSKEQTITGNCGLPKTTFCRNTMKAVGKSSRVLSEGVSKKSTDM